MSGVVIFKLKTVQTNPMRILFESLKNILSDVNFKADNTGLKLTTIDGTGKAIIHLSLLAEKFEEYICEKEINIGLNLISIYRLLKGIKNNDTIQFIIYDEDQCSLYITSEQSDKNSKITSKIKLLDMNEVMYSIPEIKYDTFITMPSSDFQSYISELSHISYDITFKSNNKNFQMISTGDFAEHNITINETNNNLNECTQEDSGVFNIKFIQLFTKSTNLCGTVEIYLKTGFPITIKYNVANLGNIKYCLAPNN